MPAETIPSSRPHAALIWLIRGTGAIIAIPSALLALFTLFTMMTLPFHHPRPQEWLMVLFLLLPVLMSGALFLVGYCMWRRADPTTAANFAFIFSFLAARALYHFLPLNLPKFISDRVGDHAPFLAQGSQPGISYRGTLAFLAFLILYRVVKGYLLRALGLILATPPSEPSPGAFDSLNPRIM